MLTSERWHELLADDPAVTMASTAEELERLKVFVPRLTAIALAVQWAYPDRGLFS